MQSIWKKDSSMPSFQTMTEPEKVETLIVGGGMTGLLCGWFLNRQGASYSVIERNRIAGGVTGNTTAKITAYHGLIYHKLYREFGKDQAAAYLLANTKALEQYRTMAVSMDCNFEKQDQYIYTAENPEKLLEELRAVEVAGGKGVFMEQISLPLEGCCAIRNPDQAQFHPLKFAAAAAKGQRGHIYEKTALLAVRKAARGWTADILNELGQELQVQADRIIIATHFPFLDRWGLYFMKMYQERSYVLALEDPNGGKLLPAEGMYIGIGKEAANPLNLSFRTYGNRLLLGGGGGRTGTAYPAYEALKEAAAKLYPKAAVTASWAAQDCMTLDGAPYIGPYAKGKDGLLVATGFQKWGMTGAMTAALALTGQLDPEIAKVFRPQRTMLRPQLAVNLFESGKNFLRPAAPRCTHLGCALRWNSSEKTWDCPCHGSRFTEDGENLNDPAQMDLRK